MRRDPCTPAEELVGIALSAPSQQAFRAESLRLLIRCAGAQGGVFQRIYPSFAPLDEAAIEGVDVRVLERSVAAWDTQYASELAVLGQASVAGGGVAIDTRVLSAQERSRRAFYADIFAPDHIREAMYCSVGLGSRELAVISLYNRARTTSFSDASVALIRSLLPAITIADGLLAKQHRKVEREITLAGLTRAEWQVAELLVLGYTNTEIALGLGRSPNTVRNQLSRLFQRAGVTTRAELVGLLSRAEATPPAPPSFADSLSPRLRQVFELLCTGASEKQIADRLGLSVHTLHQYVKAVYRAADVKSRAQLMAKALTRP